MTLKLNKYSLRIPQDLKAIYCKKKYILTIWGPLRKKSMNLKLKIHLNKLKKILTVSPIPIYNISNTERKKIKILRNTTIALIKHLFIESSILIFQKLKLVGVGFKADLADIFLKKQILILKLGFSHFTYMRSQKSLQLNSFTKTKFCIYGNSYTNISQLSARLRSKKKTGTLQRKRTSV